MFQQQIRYAVLILSLILGTTQLTVAAEHSLITLKQAVNKAVEVHGGDVLKTETADFKGRTVYRIRLVKSGHVKDLLIDAKSGELIKP